MLCLDISNIAIINVKGIAYFLQFWRNWLLKVLCLKIVDIYKMHIKEINIKIRVFDYFDNLIKVKKLETKSVLSDRKTIRIWSFILLYMMVVIQYEYCFCIIINWWDQLKNMKEKILESLSLYTNKSMRQG